MISASRVSRRFGDRLAVDNVSFTVARGEIFGLLGPNGAGKTTTLRMLGGLIPPTSGTVAVDGRPFTRGTAGALRARIGFLTETPGLWDNLTVDDNLRVYARLFGVARPDLAAERILQRFDLWDRRGDRVALLSKGMKQKLALARALVHEPEIILLDEPTANLDPRTSRTVRDLLRDLRRDGRAIVVSTHNLDEVERLADRVGLVSGSLIAMGEPAALRREVFGRRLRVRLAGTFPPLADLAACAGRAGGHDVKIDALDLSMVLEDPEASTPAVVRALVDAGAEIRGVFDEQPALEDVYLKLLGPGGAGGMNAARITVLIGKELREFRASPAVLVPVVLLVVVCTALPFMIVIVVPWAAGVSLTSDQTLQQVIALARKGAPDLGTLTPETAVEVFLFQQFLLLYLIAPIVGAVSLAAYTVVGEKQGRTLEPLLTTPLSTTEILVAKVLASFLPSVAIEAIGLCVYFGLIAALGSPGVLWSLVSWRSVLLVGVLGPFASLAALQATIAVSSRVNDPRSAQQVAVLMILPLILMLVGQIAGAFFVTTALLAVLSLGMVVAWGVLILLSVALFERETILTRWT